MSTDSSFILDPKIIAGVIAAVTSILILVMNTFISRRKNKAETKKIEIETEKLRLEVKDMLRGAEDNLENKFTYQLSGGDNINLYNSKILDGFDFKFNQTRCFENNKPVGEVASGNIEFNNGVIDVQRLNTQGRLELEFRKYNNDGSSKDYISKNTLISGERKIKVCFNVKSVGGSQKIRLVAKDKDANKWLAQKNVEVKLNEWSFVEAYFRIMTDKNFFLRLDLESPLGFPISCQIKDVVITERVES